MKQQTTAEKIIMRWNRNNSRTIITRWNSKQQQNNALRWNSKQQQNNSHAMKQQQWFRNAFLFHSMKHGGPHKIQHRRIEVFNIALPSLSVLSLFSTQLAAKRKSKTLEYSLRIKVDKEQDERGHHNHQLNYWQLSEKTCAAGLSSIRTHKFLRVQNLRWAKIGAPMMLSSAAEKQLPFVLKRLIHAVVHYLCNIRVFFQFNMHTTMKTSKIRDIIIEVHLECAGKPHYCAALSFAWVSNSWRNALAATECIRRA